MSERVFQGARRPTGEGAGRFDGGRPGGASGRDRFDRKPGKCITLPFVSGAGGRGS